ncbi:hypothetical protein FKP32DRAFT_1594889 [Trametes sanguinea]|nr:hypothetical protein FKP32DRAFT_1594889 [Trametes sanguinea]
MHKGHRKGGEFLRSIRPPLAGSAIHTTTTQLPLHASLLPSHKTAMQSQPSSSNLSSPSLVSVTTTSSATSWTPLNAKPQPPPSTKDYSAAFGQLQSQYGWGAPVPTLKTSKPKKEQKKRQEELRESETESASKKAAAAAAEQSSATRSGSSAGRTKDYEGAFGALSSRLGFGSGSRGQSKPKA